MATLNFKLAFFNEKWNLYIQTEDGEPTRFDVVTSRSVDVSGGQFRLRTYANEEIPFYVYSFGIMLDDVKQRPGNGGEWSSRSSIINPVFETELLEVGFDGWACAIDKNELEKYCPEIKCVLKKVTNEESEWRITLPNYEELGRQSFNFLHTV